MADKKLEQVIKVNDDNKIEIVKLEERISNHKKDMDKIIADFKELGIDVDEGEMVLESYIEEYDKLLAEARTKLGIV